MSEKCTLLEVTIQSLTFKNKHNLIEVILTLLVALRIDQNIIEVCNHKISNIRPKYLIH